MIEIEIKINSEYYRTVRYANEIKVNNLIADIQPKNVVACRTLKGYLAMHDLLSADSKIDIITLNSEAGIRIYKNTAIFILCKAFHKVFPNDELVIEHSIGDGLYSEIIDYTFSQKDIVKLSEEFQNIVSEEMEIKKVILDRNEAFDLVEKIRRKDIKRNISYKDVIFYKCEDYYDYIIGQVAFNTAIVKAFEISYHSPGFILRFPDKKTLKLSSNTAIPYKLFSTHQEHDKWLNILDLHNVDSLNKAVKDFKVKNLIQIEEALHEKKIVNFAQKILQKKDVRLILISGPSSSGKTTFSRRLSVQLQVNELSPKIIGMDDYFLPRDLTPKKPNGEFDYESIHALDLELLNSDLNNLMNGKEIEPPKYNFVLGKREKSNKKIILKDNEIIIMEGIHGLNDKLTEAIPFNQKLKIYVSSLNNLNIDAHNRIPTTDSRLYRRIVRDHKYRGHSPEMTFEMWHSVREGENKNIFPFQENADYIFNSSLTYELCVLKKYLMPLLKNISEYSNNYLEAQRLLEILDYFYNIPDVLVPSNSILREFIDGSIYDY